MTANTSAIITAISGGGSAGTALAWFAAVGSTAPTDSTTALAVAFKDAGWCSADGLTGKVAVEKNTVKPFGATSPVTEVVTSTEESFQVTFLESNAIAVAVYFGKGLTSIVPGTGTGVFSVSTGTASLQRYAAVFDVGDGTNTIRHYCPQVSVTDRGDFTLKPGEPVSYSVTLTAYVGSDGVAVTRFYKVPALG